MAIGSTPGGSGHVVPDDPDHRLVTPEDTVAMARMEDARFREVGVKVGELLARVNNIAVASGVAPGSPDDGKVAAFVRDVDSLTRGALDDLLQSALGPVLDSGPVHISRFGAVGDGATDDTAALVAAGASGREVHFDTDRTYNFVGPVTLTAGTRWLTHGAQFYLTATRDAPNVLIESDVYMDQLKLSFVGGDKDRGVTIRGSDVQIDAMRLVARTPSTVRNYRRRALNVGVEGSGTSNVRLGHVRIEGWLDAVAVWQSTDVDFERLTIRGYVQGLLMRDCARVHVQSGSAKSPNLVMTKGQPGENGILVEDYDENRERGDLHFGDFHVDGSGEHGFRVGGQVPITGIHFDGCSTSGTGAGSVEKHGGCGFKVLGATTNPSPTARHENVRFTNCTVEDVTPGMASGNFSGFNIGKSKNVVLDNCIVRKVNGPSSAAYGFALVGSENVSIINPTVEDTVGAAIRLYSEETTADYQFGGAATDIHITGGTLRRTTAGLLINGGGATIRRITMDGTTIDGGAHAVAVYSSILNRCSFDFLAAGITTETLLGCETAMVSGRGDLVGASAARSGSTFQDYGSYQMKVRRSDGWSAL